MVGLFLLFLLCRDFLKNLNVLICQPLKSIEYTEIHFFKDNQFFMALFIAATGVRE